MSRRYILAAVCFLIAAMGLQAADNSAPLGIFEAQNDVGNVLHPGSTEYNADTKTYVVSGGGENMWFAADEFHFVWKKVSADDVTLTADISILTRGDGHRKGLLMIRQDLDRDSAYVDAARHGDGLTSLQYREHKGDATREIESAISGPSRLRIEKQGNRFYMWIASENETLQFAGGSAKVEIRAPFYVGIGVCAHNKDAVQKVAFTNVSLEETVTHPKADYSTVETVLLSTDARVGYVSREHLTSPGWSRDGHALTFEVDGRQHETPFAPLTTAAPVGPPVTTQPDSRFVYFARNENGKLQIFRKLADGSPPEQLTSDDFNNASPYLSPDARFLVFLSYSEDLNSVPRNKDVALRIISLEDKSVKTLASFIGGEGSLGHQPWSPDGRRVTFVSYQSME